MHNRKFIAINSIFWRKVADGEEILYSYELLLYRGIMWILLTLLIGIIMLLFPKSTIYFGTKLMGQFNRKCFQSWRSFFLSLHDLFAGVSSLFTILIRYHYSPFDCHIANALNGFALWIVYLIQDVSITDYLGLIALGYVVEITEY